MHSYRHSRVQNLAAVLSLALPFAGGCGTEVDGSGDDSAAVAAAPGTLDDALSTLKVSCSAEPTRLACASGAPMLDCLVQPEGAAGPTAVTCCGLPQDQAGLKVVSCRPAASRAGGVIRPQDDGPGEVRSR